MKDLKHIIQNNVRWAQERVENDPDYFSRLAKIQAPKILWIGCSDSRVPANVITGLDSGEVFVHRNVANLVYGADLNCMSVVQFAVDALKVEHIIVCGHYGCGGVRAAFKGESDGLIDHWLEPVKKLARQHKKPLKTLSDDTARIDYLCEENVRSQMFNLAHSPIISRARDRGQDLTLHAWIYSLNNGLLRDLHVDEVNAPDWNHSTCGTKALKF
ncbi:MAG TPA: carbonate dehydratase [Hyphomicrobiales bacterium]|nr:carbonate dehydratase [Hyphomicrobiales bacterium]